jgi:hypothetical protein
MQVNMPESPMFLEHMECFPDEERLPPSPSHPHLRYHASRPGDIRAAMAPFLAHKHYVKTKQQYKWMLYGMRNQRPDWGVALVASFCSECKQGVHCHLLNASEAKRMMDGRIHTLLMQDVRNNTHTV